MNNSNPLKPNSYALIPFVIFVVSYLATGVILDNMGFELAFYAVPSPIFIIIGIIVAFVIFKGSIDKKFDTFSKGCGDENIIIMCLIYILAGAFSTVMKSTGSVDSVVNLSLSVIPIRFAAAGLFMIAAFLSTATGTSVGTVVALGSIAVGIAEKGNLPIALVLGALVGGAMFGDNLSIISDTTIAATRTQNVSMKDKFRMNFKIALPPAIITLICLLFFAKPSGEVDFGALEYSIVKIVPYLFVLISAITGMNVFVVLTSGILLACGIGIATDAFVIAEGSNLLITISKTIYDGFSGMFEIFLLSMLTGGLAHMVRNEGGIEWVITKMKKTIQGQKTAELAVSGLVSLCDIALANNTVSIIISGPVAKDLSKSYRVDPRRMASLLDIFSCVFQGLIPYGAQLLIAAGLTGGTVSPVQIIPFVWYNVLLAVFAVLSIYIRFSDAKTGWNFEKDEPLSQV